MIKKLLFTLLFINLAMYAQSQTTYYWVGGSTQSSIRTNANWNTALNGSGSVRTINATDDILIFDGSNIGGTIPTTGTINATVTSDSSSQFIFQNNVNVVFQRPTGGGGSAILSLIGGTGEDLVIDAGSSLTISGNSADGNVVMNLFAGATGSIAGNFTLSGTGVHRLTSQTIYGIVFKSTAICTVSTTPATSGYPFGSATQGKNNGIVFQSGSTLITSCTYSPMGGTSTHQAALLMPGSNYYIRSTNAASTGSWTSNKYFGNVYIQNGASYTADGSILYMDSLTIDAGCTYTTHTSGSTPITKNLVVNGTMTSPAASTNSTIMGGDGAQSISGTGTINVASLIISEVSNTTIAKSISLANTATIFGKLNFGASHVISGTATFSSIGNFTPITLTGNIVADSLRVNVTTSPIGLVGTTVSGPGIQPNTTVLALSAGTLYIVLSKPATTSTAGATLTFSSGASTLTTANPNGFDSTSGCVTVTGTKTFQDGTNYVIDAATTMPIGITSGQNSAITVGNLTLNAPVTTNKSTIVKGILSLNTGILSVRPQDTVIINNGASIAGAPFDNTKYIALKSLGANLGCLKIDSFSTSTLFPIGDATYYLPVTLSPTVISSFVVNAFQGATLDGSLTGTALTALEKANTVDANWNIHRELGSNGCGVTLGWPTSLEGTNFTNYTNAQIGLSHYELGAWSLFSGSGDNVANTVNSNFNSFSPFRIGNIINIPLPVSLSSFTGKKETTTNVINWITDFEQNNAYFTVQKSTDAKEFTTIGKVETKAVNSHSSIHYTFEDTYPSNGHNYYRLVQVDMDGKMNIISQTIDIYRDANGNVVTIYPNPTSSLMHCNLFMSNADAITINIIDITGKVIKHLEKNTTIGNNTFDIDLNNMVNGVYQVQVINNEQIISQQQIIKQD